MNKEMPTFIQNAKMLGFFLNENQLLQFDLYRREILKWNKKINLISEKSSQEINTRHFLDSLTAVDFLPSENARILDIGCGAGFPGLPIKIVRPLSSLYLLEANRKKISFLKNIVRLLDLSDTVIWHERAEKLLKNIQWQNFFNVVISRAAFKLSDLLPLGSFFLKQDGLLIAFKSADIEEEFLKGVEIAPRYGFNKLFQHDTGDKLPGLSRKIIIGKKTK